MRLVGSPPASSESATSVSPRVKESRVIGLSVGRRTTWLCVMLPRRLLAVVTLYPGVLVGSQQLAPRHCPAAPPPPVFTKVDPNGPNGTPMVLGALATIAMEPRILSAKGSAEVSGELIPQFAVRFFSSEKVASCVELRGHPQHSPISSSSSKT